MQDSSFNPQKEEAPCLFNERLHALVCQLHHTVMPVSYHSELHNAVLTVRGTLIGYWYDFGRPFLYRPRLTFLPIYDMDRHRWTALNTANIIYPSNILKKEENIMTKKDTIIIHCTATRATHDVHVADIDLWHRQRGFRSVGYHYHITLDGRIETGRPYDEEGAHTLGWNRRAIGISYAGGIGDNGLPADTRTPEQREALKQLIVRLHAEHPELVHLFGHRDLARKACPCFDAQREYGGLLFPF